MRGSSVPAYTPPPLRGKRFAGADHEGGAADSHLPSVHSKIFFKPRARCADLERIPCRLDAVFRRVIVSMCGRLSAAVLEPPGKLEQ
jgi:hypothetical protein